jgi:hypothetical protein
LDSRERKLQPCKEYYQIWLFTIGLIQATGCQSYPALSGDGYRLFHLGTTFAEKLVLEKGKVSDPVFTEPIQFILRISEVLGS